jgi:hypothetical protein
MKLTGVQQGFKNLMKVQKMDHSHCVARTVGNKIANAANSVYGNIIIYKFRVK